LVERWATFDCYGTLIDWERGIKQTLARLWPEADASALLARYHEIEPQVQQGSNARYTTVLREVLSRIATAEGRALAPEEADALGRSLPDWPPFDEVPDALRTIRAAGWHTAILSNTDPELLDASIARIGIAFDLRITVAEAGSYKPAPGHWKRFFAESGASRDAHVHIGASIFHDIEPANVLGLRAVWINRSGEQSDVPRDFELPDLGRLSEVLDQLVHG
jgi:2-haloacid dehalogenase